LGAPLFAADAVMHEEHAIRVGRRCGKKSEGASVRIGRRFRPTDWFLRLHEVKLTQQMLNADDWRPGLQKLTNISKKVLKFVDWQMMNADSGRQD
jgi:hypothetical protein